MRRGHRRRVAAPLRVHVTPTVAKVAAGAIEHLALAVVPGVPDALRQLDELGVTSVGLDATAESSLFDLEIESGAPMALVMGAEDRGLAALTRRRCSVLAAIPQFGALGSLNVAAAGAVACFELARAGRGEPGRTAGDRPARSSTRVTGGGR